MKNLFGSSHRFSLIRFPFASQKCDRLKCGPVPRRWRAEVLFAVGLSA
jgi:hypothetical protein